MRVYLENLLKRLQQGNEDAVLLDPKTLEEMLLEMQGMCQSGDGIKVEPRIALAGFKIQTDDAAGGDGEGVANAYTMGTQAASGGFTGSGDSPYTDTWSVENGATTDGATPVVGAFDGVRWLGPRFYVRTNAVTTVTDSNGDTVDALEVTIEMYSRALTYDSTGKLVSISAEDTGGANAPGATASLIVLGLPS